MKKFFAVLSLAVISLLSPIAGHAQQHHRALVNALHRSHFKIDNLSTREKGDYIYVDGEITNNSNQEASTVFLTVRWTDEHGIVVATGSTHVSNLAPGKTLPFEAGERKKRDMKNFDVAVNSVHGR